MLVVPKVTYNMFYAILTKIQMILFIELGKNPKIHMYIQKNQKAQSKKSRTKITKLHALQHLISDVL
jgi:hypothetical protein